MSLLVWLPLNNSIDNQGTQLFSITQNGISYTDGKVTPSCALFDSDSDHIRIEELAILNNLSKYTLSCWVNLNNLSTYDSHSSAFMSSGNWNVLDKQFVFGVCNYNSGFRTIQVPNNTGGCYAGISLAAEDAIQLNTWYHILITFDGTITKGYVNGKYVGSYTGSKINISEVSYFYLGAATYYSGFTMKGKLNDFRIYDEALSEEEIYKLSKGLCTHYSFDFEDLYTPIDYIQTDGNQYINSGIIGKAKWIYDIQYLDNSKRQLMGHGGNAGEYWGVTDGKYGKASWSTSTVPTGNRDIFQVNNFSGVQTAGTGGNVYINGTYAYNNGYDSRSESTQAQIFAISGIYTAICKLWSCQVYNISNELIRDFIPALRNADGKPGLYDKVNNVFYTNDGTGEFNYIGAASSIGARDSSGYGNTGIINELTMSWDAKIGTNSLVWDTNYAHNLKTQNKIDFLYSGGHFTLNLWAKRNNTTMVLFATGNPGYNSGVGRWWGIQADGTWTISGISDYTCYIDGIASSAGVLDTNWHMYTITGTFTTTWDELCFENHIDASQWGIDGKICDIKLFATKLSADDIKKLYGSRLTIKNGILSCDEYTSKYLDNSYSSRGVVSASSIASGDKNCNLALYTQLEYIESNGTQYIDTGYSNSEGFAADLKFMLTSVPSTCNGYIIGCHNLSSPYGRNGFQPYWGQWQLGHGDVYPLAGTPLANILYDGEVDTKKGAAYLKLNGETVITDNGSTALSSLNVLLFTDQYVWTYDQKASYAKLYSCKIYTPGKTQLVRNFIPVKRNLFGDIGLYDTVENKFYGSATIYPFIAGPELGRVLDCNKLYIGQGYNGVQFEESDFDEIEYLESTGTQYIDTGIEIKNGLNTELDYQFVSYDSSERYVFGLDSPTVFGMINGSGRIYEFGAQRYTFTLDNNRHKVTVGQNIIFDGTTVATGITGTNTGKNGYLFASNTSSGTANYYSSTKLYSCRMYINNTLLRDFIPVIRKSDKKPGLYDKVNKRFYTAWGVGEFIAGPNVFKHLDKDIKDSDPIKYFVAVSAEYCKAVYTSTDSAAASGNITNTWYTKNSTVYGFATLNNNTAKYSYTPQNYWYPIATGSRTYNIGQVTTDTNKSIIDSAIRTVNKYTLDLNPYINGTHEYDGATMHLIINGVDQGWVTDYCQAVDYGTTWKVIGADYTKTGYDTRCITTFPIAGSVTGDTEIRVDFTRSVHYYTVSFNSEHGWWVNQLGDTVTSITAPYLTYIEADDYEQRVETGLSSPNTFIRFETMLGYDFVRINYTWEDNVVTSDCSATGITSLKTYNLTLTINTGISKLKYKIGASDWAETTTTTTVQVPYSTNVKVYGINKEHYNTPNYNIDNQYETIMPMHDLAPSITCTPVSYTVTLYAQHGEWQNDNLETITSFRAPYPTSITSDVSQKRLITTLGAPLGYIWFNAYSGYKLDNITNSWGTGTSFTVTSNGNISAITSRDVAKPVFTNNVATFKRFGGYGVVQDSGYVDVQGLTSGATLYYHVYITETATSTTILKESSGSGTVSGTTYTNINLVTYQAGAAGSFDYVGKYIHWEVYQVVDGVSSDTAHGRVQIISSDGSTTGKTATLTIVS